MHIILRKLVLLISLLFISATLTYGQQPLWYQPIQGGGHCTSIEIDSNGYVYSAGFSSKVFGADVFNDTIIPKTIDGRLLYLTKTDTNYHIEWLKVFESTWLVYKPIIKIDKNNDIVIVGKYYDDLKIDTINIVEDNRDAHCFVAKFNNNGHLLWLNTIRADFWTLDITDVDFDSDNNIYISGWYNVYATFNNGITPDTTIYGWSTSFIAKYQSSGAFHNVYSLRNSNQLKLNSLAIAKDNYMYATGWCAGKYYFGNDSITTYNSDIIIVKYDLDFNVLWIKNIGSQINSSIEEGNSIALDKNHEHIYVTGTFIGPANFGDGIVNSNDKNIFLVKYRTQGEFVWVRTDGSWSGLASIMEEGREVFVDNEDFIYVIGNFKGQGMFGDTILNGFDNNFDIYLAKYYTTGELSWATNLGHDGFDDEVHSVTKDHHNNIFVAGSTTSPCIFGEYQLTTECNIPGYIGRIKDFQEDNKYDISGGLHIINKSNNFLAYPNPASLYFSISNNIGYNITEISLFNQHGQKVLYEQNKYENINISILHKGMYIIEIVSNETITRKKLVIK